MQVDAAEEVGRDNQVNVFANLPPSAASFVEGARDYIEAACKLIDGANASSAVEPIGLLASHGLELALKAYLFERGMSPEDARREFGHDLLALWVEAIARGLPIEAEPPYWLRVLNFSYDSPYLFRYRPEGIGVAIPDVSMLGEELQRVLAAVELRVVKTTPA